MSISPLLMAQLSDMAYYPPSKAKFGKYGYDVEKFIESKETDTQLYILNSRAYNHNVIVFRGTSSLRDFYTDIEIEMEEVFLWKGRWLRVHAGFLDAWRSVEKEILKNDIAGVKTYVAGHSLGGALAVISALELFRIIPDVECYTFGTPKVGSFLLGKYFKLNNIEHHCYVRKGDLIPASPPEEFGYHHLSDQIELPGIPVPSWVKIALFGVWLSYFSHRCSGYIRMLKIL